MAHDTPPQWDRTMRRRLRRGEAAALAELYDRFAPLAFTIASRVLEDDADEDAAALVTRAVFTRIWEAPDVFDPAEGPMRSWIADQAHGLAVERLRATAGPGPDRAAPRDAAVRAASTAARADYIVTSMPAPLRDALELSRTQAGDYREIARRLGISEDEARRRLRLGLQLLSTAGTYDAATEAP